MSLAARIAVHGPPAPAVTRGAITEIVDDAVALLRDRTGVDFSHYRRATIERRLINRMVAARAASPQAYLSLLRSDEDEAGRLVSTLTINVSRFYRNAAVFDRLREQIVPSLRERFPREAIRAWSAGCAAGEEAYTLAMILEESDQILATDIDRQALVAAVRGEYRTEVLTETPASLVSTFTRPATAAGMFIPGGELRRRVQFAHHDLGSGVLPANTGPFHLICCRNVLIYFARPLQQRVVELLIGALLPGGVLCLGEAEWPPGNAAGLAVLDRKLRLFRRVVEQEEE